MAVNFKKLFLSKWSERLFLFFILAITLFFVSYKLTESPPTWYDEGFIIQSAENLMANGRLGIQIEPGVIIEEATFFSTGFPVAYPVGWALQIFGKNLLSARSVMVFFCLLLVGLSYFLIKRIWGFKTAVLSSLLLISFASLYGNGKNVLGEVPGLFFLVAFLYFLYRIEEKNYLAGYRNYFLAGLFLGLCLATKSIFLILPAALFFSLLIYWRKINWNWSLIGSGFLGFMVSLFFLFKTQFSAATSLGSVFGDYLNPSATTDVFYLAVQNFVRFFIEAAPLYLLVMMIIWAGALIIRFKFFKEKIALTETVAFVFSGLIGLSYLHLAGWSRYLFPAQIIALLFFPVSAKVVIKFLGDRFKIKLPTFTLVLLVAILFAIQLYQLCFGSWVAGYYNSHNTRDLEAHFSGLNPTEKIFLYDAPEIATFLPSKNYRQYLKINDNLIIGQEELKSIENGLPDKIIINIRKKEILSSFSLYEEKIKVSKYLILEKK